MRAAGALAAAALAHAGRLVAPGVTTDALDAAAHDYITAAGGYPSPLGYGGFPKSVCTSVNECICHGVPDDRCAGDRFCVVTSDILVVCSCAGWWRLPKAPTSVSARCA